MHLNSKPPHVRFLPILSFYLDLLKYQMFLFPSRQRSSCMMKSFAATAATFALVLLASVAATRGGGLQVGFYKGKCGAKNVEGIVRAIVQARFSADPTIAAALMRMQFHDCFVRGCDASILLDGNSTEKTAPPNFSIRGYDLIDEVKDILEGVCPGVVSCADIIVIATRDAVAMAGGPMYEVPTGRRDGTVSQARDVDLPSPFMSAADSACAFGRRGLDTTDMVVLLGGHGVGVTHCSFISSRLYNFLGTGRPDPDMDPALVSQLRERCPQDAVTDNTVFLDQNLQSAYIVDNSYYQQIAVRRGVLQIDQELGLHPITRETVAELASGATFLSLFGRAMVKLGTVEVLTGDQGIIRWNCRLVNMD